MDSVGGVAAPPPAAAAAPAPGGGSGGGGVAPPQTETKVIYHLDDEETPYLVKLSGAVVSLGDLKAVLNKPHHKYFFKSQDADFG